MPSLPTPGGSVGTWGTELNDFLEVVHQTDGTVTAASVTADSTTLVGTGTDVQSVLEELDNGIADHLADTSAAHAASAISADSTTLVGTGTTVQAVFEELDNAIVTKLDKLLVTNTQTDSYTLVLGDADKVVEMNKGSANNLTVPLFASVAFPVGTVISVFQLGAGQTTIVATGGVTIHSPSAHLKLTGQYSSAALRLRAQDEWVATGDLAA